MGAHASHESRQTSLLAYAEIAPSLSQRVRRTFPCEKCGAAFVPAHPIASNGRRPSRFCSRRCWSDNARQHAAERFWRYVNKAGDNDCWLWTGAKQGTGYGNMTVGRGPHVRAHRFSYEIAFGPIPAGLSVCHRCDVPLCVNPAHLFLGTHLDNMRDMTAKGRRVIPTARRGSDHRQAALTAGEVVEVVLRLKAGESQSAIGRSFGVSQNLIHKIARGKSYRHEASRAFTLEVG